MPRLKICGINDVEFARAADAAGADYLGFIFEVSSPRCVTEHQAAEIAGELSQRVRKVGVFVRQPVEEIVETMQLAGLDVVQLHRVATEEEVAALWEAGFETWTLDGGTRSDWSRVEAAHERGVRAVLAGGLGTDNLAEAAATGADVLDVNSSLETAPGIKSIERLNELFARTRT